MIRFRKPISIPDQVRGRFFGIMLWPHAEPIERNVLTSAIGTSRTSRDVRLESAKWAKPDRTGVMRAIASVIPTFRHGVTHGP
jgi:hypothetical protein